MTPGYHDVRGLEKVLQRAWHMASSASERAPQNHIYTVKAFMPHYALNFLGSGLSAFVSIFGSDHKKTQAKYENIKA